VRPLGRITFENREWTYRFGGVIGWGGGRRLLDRLFEGMLIAMTVFLVDVKRIVDWNRRIHMQDNFRR